MGNILLTYNMQVRKGTLIIISCFLVAFVTTTLIILFYLNNETENSTGWISNGISDSSQGNIWKPTKYRTFRKQISFQNRSRKSTHTEVSCHKWAVLTTIFEPTEVSSQFLSMKDWCLVVVADKKTDPSKWKEVSNSTTGNLFYLSPEKQIELNYHVLQYTKWNHFGVKNIGYLFAIENGAKLIWDTDDDNFLRDKNEFRDFITKIEKDELSISCSSSNSALMNPYPMFYPIKRSTMKREKISWPRGFPLEYIKDRSTFDEKSEACEIKSDGIGIFQSLADIDPDVDGIYRLTKQMPLIFKKKNDVIAVNSNQYSPFNAQATLWTEKAFWGLLMPVSVHGRVTDIWRSYITLRLMQEINLQLAFTGPLVKQHRNSHKLVADLRSEQPLYTQSKELVKWLINWKNKGELYDIMKALAVELYEIGILQENDVQLYYAWISDLQSFGYTFPSLKNDSHSDVDDLREEVPTIPPRTAVCVSGQPRTLVMSPSDPDYPEHWRPMRTKNLPVPTITVAESVQKNLYPRLGDVDTFMYVSTKETEHEPSIGNKSICEPLRPPSGHLGCEVVEEQELPIFKDVPMWEFFRRNGYEQGLLQQLYGMSQCHRMILMHEQKTGKSYDWIVRYRPDTYIETFPNIPDLTTLLKPTVYFGSKERCCCGNEDTFAIGARKPMEEYLRRYFYFQTDTRWYQEGKRWSAELMEEKILNLNNISLSEHKDITACVVKPRHRSKPSDP